MLLAKLLYYILFVSVSSSVCYATRVWQIILFPITELTIPVPYISLPSCLFLPSSLLTFQYSCYLQLLTKVSLVYTNIFLFKFFFILFEETEKNIKKALKNTLNIQLFLTRFIARIKYYM